MARTSEVPMNISALLRYDFFFNIQLEPLQEVWKYANSSDIYSN
jgi:hypothetical protein